MDIDIFWIHAGIMAGILIIAYIMQMNTARLRAKFNLYRVRDRFVLLVADETLSETSHIFTYFYKRINNILADEHHLGVDDLLHIMFRDMKNGDFDRAIIEAKAQANKIAADPDAKNEKVRAAIADYYSALRLLLIANSSILRVAYKVSHFVVGAIIDKILTRFVPEQIRHGLAAINYAEKEADIFTTA